MHCAAVLLPCTRAADAPACVPTPTPHAHSIPAAEVEEDTSEKDGVRLMTVHASKGLEFEVGCRRGARGRGTAPEANKQLSSLPSDAAAC